MGADLGAKMQGAGRGDLEAGGPPRVQVGVILLRGVGRVALVERGSDGSKHYVFPGGPVEQGESPARSAARHALAELSLVVGIGRLVAEGAARGVRSYYYLASEAKGGSGPGKGEDLTPRGGRREGGNHPVWVHLAWLPYLDVRPAVLAEALIELPDLGWPAEVISLAGREPVVWNGRAEAA